MVNTLVQFYKCWEGHQQTMGGPGREIRSDLMYRQRRQGKVVEEQQGRHLEEREDFVFGNSACSQGESRRGEKQTGRLARCAGLCGFHPKPQNTSNCTGCKQQEVSTALFYSLALSYSKCLHGGMSVNNRILEYTLGKATIFLPRLLVSQVDKVP